MGTVPSGTVPNSPKVTVGTAGKVFLHEPGAWRPLPKLPPVEEKKITGSIAKVIDHTQLSPIATAADIEKLCREAKEFSFAAVCVHPSYIRLAASLLKGSSIQVAAVVGFPLGANTTLIKSIETQDAIANGASEIDMVLSLGNLKSGNHKETFDEICSIRKLTEGRILKVIIETALLSKEEKVRGAVLVKEAGADFVKTSTGFSSGGATVEDVEIVREAVGPKMGIKASGGIRTLELAQQLIRAGATRLGSSRSVEIVTQERSESGFPGRVN